jgi:type I restriction enzyme M protein
MALSLNNPKLDNLAGDILIARPIIRWEDSPQFGYEILPIKCFYRYQPPTPARDLLAEVWKLEKEAEKRLEGLAK